MKVSPQAMSLAAKFQGAILEKQQDTQQAHGDAALQLVDSIESIGPQNVAAPQSGPVGQSINVAV